MTLEGSRCDFCMSGDVIWVEECGEAVMPLKGSQHGRVVDTPYIGHTYGGWASCQDCHQLIADDKRESVARRAARSMRQVQPETRAALASGAVTWSDINAMVRELQAPFWAKRTGTFVLAQR